MEPTKAELEALRGVLMTPLEEFVGDRDAATRTEDQLEALAQKRMFSQAVKAVDHLRGQRELYLVGIGFGPQWVQAFGPYPTRNKAEQASLVIRGALGNLVKVHGVMPLTGDTGWKRMLEEADEPPAVSGDYAEVATDAQAFRRGWKGESRERARYVERVVG